MALGMLLRMPFAGTRGPVPGAAYATAVLPVLLVAGFGLDPLPAFVFSLLFGHVALGARRSVKLLTQSIVEGVSSVAPATALMMGLGMLLQAIWHPSVKAALAPWLAAVTPAGP